MREFAVRLPTGIEKKALRPASRTDILDETCSYESYFGVEVGHGKAVTANRELDR